MEISRRGVLAAGVAALTMQGQEQKKLKLAIIGTGHRAWEHIRLLKGMPEFEVVALADPTPEFRDRAATLAGGSVRTYSTYQEMLAKEKDLDGVIVSPPQFAHAEAAIAVLSHGLHVFCEKPMATSVEDANRMIEAVNKSGKIFQIGQQWRYMPLYEKMAELVRQGQIGSIQYAIGSNFRGDWNPESWRYTDPKTGVATNWRFLRSTTGTTIMEASIHQIDVFHGMIGSRLARISATGGNNVLKQRETVDHASIWLEYENGVKFEFGMCLFARNPGPINRMVLIGSEGTMQPEAVAEQTPTITSYGPTKIGVRKPGVRAPQLFEPAATPGSPAGAQASGEYRELIAFAQAIRTGRQPLCNAQVGKEAMKICLLAQKSIDEHRVVSWNDLPA